MISNNNRTSVTTSFQGKQGYDHPHKNNTDDSFSRIIGYEDIKKELRIISDMIANPDIYEEMGATMTRGVLLYGNPGTGKTTMADTLIESTGRKSYICRKKSANGSFVEDIVRVFEKAKENAPAIVLLDDLDKYTEKNDDDAKEAEEFVAVQTCIDEMTDRDVFVVATVNNKERLPDSLLRPGRLGKAYYIRNPRKDETESIIRYYLDGTNKGKDLDPTSIAMMLQGESCAMLEDVIRTSAIKSAYKRQERISMDDIVDACLDLVFETNEFDKPYSNDTLKMTAYHEGGHALVAELLDPGSVSIASIRPTGGNTLGLVRYCRKESEEYTFEYYENILKTSLAGKAATEIVFGEPDLGAYNDLDNAFRKAKRIADNYCVYGFHNWIQDRSEDFSAENRNRTMAMIMERNYMEVKKLLINNRNTLDKLAAELLEKTTLIHSDISRIMEEHSRLKN